MSRAIVFDLDGTLADTASLPKGTRSPWQVLAPGLSRPDDLPDLRWSFEAQVSDLPGKLLACGYRVAILTRAPIAYASTLVHLLGLDTELIQASAGGEESKAHHLTRLAERWGIPASDLVYVGDTDADAAAAKLAGCIFRDAAVLRKVDMAKIPAIAPYERPETARVGETGGGPLPSYHPITLGSLVQISEQIRGGVPDLAVHAKLFREVTLNAEISDADKAAIAFFSLLANPAVPHRSELQDALLRRLTPAMRSCLIQDSPALFQIHPQVITRFELRMSPSLYEQYLAGLARLFDKRTESFLGTTHLYIVPYQSRWGHELGRAKNYGLVSGPQPKLGKLDLIADVIAAHVPPNSQGKPLVPVAARPGSAQHPAQCSLRLAFMVGKRTQRQVFPILNHDGGLVPGALIPKANKVLLIDDQVTTGKSVTSAATTLRNNAIEVAGVISYSKSTRLSQTTDRCLFEPIANLLNRRCMCS